MMQEMLRIAHPKLDGGNTIQFGIPQTTEEIRLMHQLRYQVYIEKKQYIPANLCTDGIEIDHIDQKGGCDYFIAQSGRQVIGTVRVIRQDPLPIQHYYWRYEEPGAMKRLRQSQKAEIGRLISQRPYGSQPLGLVPLGLLYCALQFSAEHNLRAGYANLKLRLIRQMERLAMPIHKIDAYQCIFKEDGEDPIKNYFNNPDDPGCPTYFFLEEMVHFYQKLLSASSAFQPVSSCS